MSRLKMVFNDKKTTLLATAGISVLIAVVAELLRNIFSPVASRYISVINIVLLVVAAMILFLLLDLREQVERVQDRTGEIATTDQVEVLRTSIERLNKHIGFAIEYYRCGGRGSDAIEKFRKLHDAAGAVIREAPDRAQIFAVNSYVEVFAESNTEEGEQIQRNYLKEFIDRTDCRYHRLLQLKNGRSAGSRQPPLSELITPAYLDHYREMADRMVSRPHMPIMIGEVSAKLPTSFVVVKDANSSSGKIIWQINQHATHAHDPDAEEMMGIFVITDPQGILIPRFVNWFEMLERTGKRPLQPQNLE